MSPKDKNSNCGQGLLTGNYAVQMGADFQRQMLVCGMTVPCKFQASYIAIHYDICAKAS
jgi:hypothetical protein